MPARAAGSSPQPGHPSLNGEPWTWVGVPLCDAMPRLRWRHAAAPPRRRLRRPLCGLRGVVDRGRRRQAVDPHEMSFGPHRARQPSAGRDGDPDRIVPVVRRSDAPRRAPRAFVRSMRHLSRGVSQPLGRRADRRTCTGEAVSAVPPRRRVVAPRDRGGARAVDGVVPPLVNSPTGSLPRPPRSRESRCRCRGGSSSRSGRSTLPHVPAHGPRPVRGRALDAVRSLRVEGMPEPRVPGGQRRQRW